MANFINKKKPSGAIETEKFSGIERTKFIHAALYLNEKEMIRFQNADRIKN